MLPNSLLGVAIVLAAIYIGFRLLKSIAKIGFLALILLLAGYLIFGGIPQMAIPDNATLPDVQDLKEIQNSSIGSIIVAVKNVAWGAEILGADFDSDGTLVVVVANTGQFPLEGLDIYVNGELVGITNSPPGLLEKGDIGIFDTDYQARGPAVIRVRAGRAETELAVNLE